MPNPDDVTGEFGADLLRELRRTPSFGGPARTRVMNAVRRESLRPRFVFIRRWRGERPGWMSPAVGASLAAALLLVTTFAPRLDLRRDAEVPAASGAISAAIRDTLMLVRFALHAPGAGTVALVGDFTGWRRDSIYLRPEGRGDSWVANVPLTRGEHRYAFVVDDTAWVIDPGAPSDPKAGGASSRLVVPTP